MDSPDRSLGPWPGATLPPREVHVAVLHLAKTGHVLPFLESILADDEKERASRFRFDADRNGYIAGRGGLRVMLAHYVGERPDRLRFDSNEFGKPTLAGRADIDIRFNLSHSASIALFAFTRGSEVGVDVEQIRTDVPYLDLASRLFSAAEVASLQSEFGERRIEHFFRTWTLKEAYVKGRGTGLSIPLGQFSVCPDTTQIHEVEHEAGFPDPGMWYTVVLDLVEGYAAAVAASGDDWIVRCFDALPLLEDSEVNPGGDSLRG